MGAEAVTAPLLRAPPFPGVGPIHVALSGDEAAAGDSAALFAHLRAARVGGAFWDSPVGLPGPAEMVVRPRDAAEVAALAPASPALWVAASPARTLRQALARRTEREGGEWRASVDPWSALAGAGQLLAHGDDEWVALARIAGVPVRVLSPGRFGTPGEDDAVLDRHAFRALTSAHYRDPFTGSPSTLEATIDLLAEWRRIIEANRGIVVASGMAWWKRAEIRRFLWSSADNLRMVSSPRRALTTARRRGGAVAIWPSRVSPVLLAEAKAQGVPLVRVEDGFVRSVGLGSNLVPPSSIVVDRGGIHFDPSRPSDLEAILARTAFSPELLERARSLRETIVAAGISKYAAGTAENAPRRGARRLVLVPGQVEDDMSVIAGGGGLRSNLELLRRARALEPDAEIWFRPHPDVDAGHRKGAVPDGEVLQLADRIARGGGMAPLLDTVDGVHVLTSLTGFEALMRGRDVTCHGTPFYAGWGLTRDLGAVPDRRGRALALDELVAGVLILYPRYLDPITGLPCPPEVLVGRMASDRAPNRLEWIAPLRRWQGQLMARLNRRGTK
ncbi:MULTISPECIES: capsular polysaccharide export protein, LipB/KpsS family [unclassified Novosphingobium]|uniref:capsular polysaccharide export protein, LipB/KpsS family n=1 Tax=unclassified Novosphingobium TaxID=2644732 RepID=UPI00086CD64B|nr:MULTISPECIES: beta-3-deoxy-D-manno-oct-2-ulosonic acid transferase [unclassified Novosphingobium]MBN9142638.1 beta-3-deoxy-D-manno-oct-2-ulosonic acid transferase [Novosphingobium sp.]ODU80406.1 MAG: capsule biosynthesis protein [Novosphingobium sp. SCN 63-17]OJX89051.1 MAG: beta-3-deoxy-D-manno-oct-2-ulosonic acid transferase [Novosphingobium sp. 63-713]